MKPLNLLLFLFAALATAASPGTDNSENGASSKPRGEKGAIYLDVQCTTDAECAGSDKGGACGKKENYLAVFPEGRIKGDRASYACAYAKVLTGVCSYGDDDKHKNVCACFPPDDAACSYVESCARFPPLEGCTPDGEPHVPKAIVDDTGDHLCACVGSCEKARAGFVSGPPPEDDCSKPYEEPGGSDPVGKGSSS